MSPIAKLLRLTFYLLYHSLAPTYDYVADLVSLGQWRAWIQEIIPYLQGTRLLELGHGPGHLQRFLLDLGLLPFGLDESAPMGRLARRNLRKSGYTQIALTRGLAQYLPFPANAFSTVVATFPSDYIFDPHTLSEIRRVLRPKGRLVVLLSVCPSDNTMPARFSAWLFRITGQVVQSDRESANRLRVPFERAGWTTTIEYLNSHGGRLAILLAWNLK